MDKQQILSLLATRGKEAEALRGQAEAVRHEHVGDSVYIRGIIEFSNYCRRNCLYCGISGTCGTVKRYRLSSAEILEAAGAIREQNIATIVLQSGEDPYYTRERMTEIIREVKQLGVRITLSIGEHDEETYRAYREAGADRFLLRIETTNPNLYGKLHPGYNLQNRIACLHTLRGLGFETGTGTLIGLPGQTISDLANDLLFFQEFQPHMLGSGPFVAHPGTALSGSSSPEKELVMNFFALQRIMCPHANIAATTALDALWEDGRMKALAGGANVYMPNFTTAPYRAYYLLYPNKQRIDQSNVQDLQELADRLQSMGRKLDFSFGDSTVKAR